MIDDVVELMETVSSTNQPPKQVNGDNDGKITLAFEMTAAALELWYSFHGIYPTYTQ